MNNSNSGCFNILIIIVLILLALIFIFFDTGLNIIYFIKISNHLKLDQGQFWSLSIIISFILFFILFFISNMKFSITITIYTLINILTVGIDLLSYFLFKNNFLLKLLHVTFNIKI